MHRRGPGDHHCRLLWGWSGFRSEVVEGGSRRSLHDCDPRPALRGYASGVAVRPRAAVAEEPTFAVDARKKLVMIIRNPVWPVWLA